MSGYASSNVGFRVVLQLDDAPQPGWQDRPLVRNPSQSLSRLALVLHPEPIPGLRSWSVELAGTHGSGNMVTFLNLSPDGRRLLVRAYNGRTFVRDHQAPTPRLLGQHLGLIAEWHPDSRRFVGWDASYGSVGFDVETNRRLGTHFPWLVDKHW